jgi:Tfp pilus assembly protein PilO
VSKISKAKKQQIFLVLICTASVISGLWYLVIQNQYAGLAAANKKTAEMTEKVTKGENLLKRAEEIETTLDNETKTLDEIEQGMASGDVYSWLINTVNNFNTTRQITFLDFQREIVGEVGTVPKFPYKAAIFPVKGTGYYHQIGKFIAEFENSFPYIRVQNLELSPLTGKGGADAEKLNFKFEIVALIKGTGQ